MHVAAPGAVGGLESVVQALAIGQSRASHRVMVPLVVEPDQELNGLLTPFQGTTVDLRVLRVPPRAYVRERALIRDLCMRFQPDVVHSLRRFGVANRRIHVIPNAWSGHVPRDRRAARQALGLSPDEFVIGWVGRLIPVKGADVFLEALSELSDLPWSASILGDGVERRRLERVSATLRLGGRVTFHGQVDDAPNLFRAFDAVVLSSRSEGTPMALLEAIAAGVPVVATAVGGVPDVIGPGEALLVQPDQPTAVAQAIR